VRVYQYLIIMPTASFDDTQEHLIQMRTDAVGCPIKHKLQCRVLGWNFSLSCFYMDEDIVSQLAGRNPRLRGFLLAVRELDKFSRII
jgi:hypothetical protein